MNSKTTATCQHCKKEVPPDRIGPCPYCGKVGKDITVALPVAIEMAKDGAFSTVIRRQLDKDERSLWDKLIIFLGDKIIIDGFEVGFPSGIKVIFRRKK